MGCKTINVVIVDTVLRVKKETNRVKKKRRIISSLFRTETNTKRFIKNNRLYKTTSSTNIR